MNEEYINIRVDDGKSSIEDFSGRDPFRQNWEVLKSYRGLDDPNAKRRISRKANFWGQTNVTPSYESESMMQPTGSGATSKQINPGKDTYLNGYSAFDVITPPHNLYQLAHFYDSNFANHAAVDAKVLNIVGGGFKLEMTPKARRKLSEADQDNVIKFIHKKVSKVKTETEEWIDGLNDSSSFTDTMRRVVADLESTGNGYIEIGRTANGTIGYVGHIPSITMRVRRLRDGYVQIIGQKVVYFRNFGATNSDPLTGDSQPNEIIHVKKYSPLNTYYGVPDITSAMPSLIGDQMAEQYNIDYFENKAVPRYIIKVKGARLSADAEERLFRFMQTNLKGNHHRTIVIPLPGDTPENKVEFEMIPIESGVQEASFADFRTSNRDNILMAHQVPLSKLGGGNTGAIATAISQDRTFRDQVCRPTQRELEKAIAPIIKEKTDIVELLFNEMNIVDEVQQSAIHKTYFDAGAILPNEIREAIGLPAIDGLDDKQERLERERMEFERDATMERETQRMAQQSDGGGAAAGRNPKGSGAKEDGNTV